MNIRLIGAARLPASARRPALVRKAVRLALGRRAGRGGELNVVFVSDREIRRLNKSFLRHDYATDVIAFPYDGGEAFGDVVVSVDTARRQAAELGHPLLKEVLTLAAHGTLHLVGHDDRRPADKARMFRAQDRVLAKVLGRARR